MQSQALSSEPGDALETTARAWLLAWATSRQRAARAAVETLEGGGTFFAASLAYNRALGLSAEAAHAGAIRFAAMHGLTTEGAPAGVTVQ